MALHRGIQSAIFYYISCAPCTEAKYRKKRKREAARDRIEREALEAEQPDLYRHPAPSSTNKNWHAEISLGPTRARGKRKPTNTNGGPQAAVDARVGSNQPSEVPSTVDLAPEHELGLNKQQKQALYQRPDEALWGSTASLDGAAHIQRPPKARTRDSAYRNPPVNDRHPATVTRVTSPNDVAWMMQPPPPPAVMSGKMAPAKSTSMAGSSRLSPQSLALSRQASSISERMLASRDRPTSTLSHDGSRRASVLHTPQRHELDHVADQRDFAVEPSPGSRISASEPSEDPVLNTVPAPALLSDHWQSDRPNHRTTRPPIWTVLTDSAVRHSSGDEFYTPGDTPRENSHPSTSTRSGSSTKLKPPYARHSAVLVHDDPSFQLVQDLHPGAAVRVYAKPPAAKQMARVRHVWGDSTEDASSPLSSSPGVPRPELFESWHMPDFELPKWVHEHTKREVRERWSMDL